MKKLMVIILISVLACMINGCGTTQLNSGAGTLQQLIEKTSIPDDTKISIAINGDQLDITALSGSVEPNSTVRLYNDVMCTSLELKATLTANASGGFIQTVARADFDLNFIYITATSASKAESTAVPVFF